MFAVEHADRFTVSLPNGGSMDVSKDGLRPETVAELRSMVVPNFATRGDVTEGELDLIERETALAEQERAADAVYRERAGAVLEDLTNEVGGPPPERYLRRSENLLQREVLGELDRSVGDLPKGPRVIDPSLVSGSRSADPVMASRMGVQEEAPPAVAPMLDLDPAMYPPAPPPVGPMQLPGPGAGSAAPFGQVSLIPSFGDAVSALFGGRGESDAGGEGAVVKPPAPHAAPPAPPPDPNAELRARFEALARQSSSGRAPQVAAVGRVAMEPFEVPQAIKDAYAAQMKANADLAAYDRDTAVALDQMAVAQEAEKRAVIERLSLEREAEQRRLDAMREAAFNGEINVNRAFDRMDNGQRALSVIGLILGGIGAGNTGVNASVAVLERMVDRDIDAQAKDLGRKQTAYSEAIRQGYQAEQARQMAKAEAFSLLDGALARAAARAGGERQLLAAQAVNAALGERQAVLFENLRGQHETRQINAMELEQRRRIENARLAAEAEKMRSMERMALYGAMRKEDPLLHTLPNGQQVRAANPTSKKALEDAQGAHQDFVAGIAMLEKLRRENPGGRIIPSWLSFMGIEGAESSKIGESVTGAVRLAFLKAQGAGAYDKGSGELSKAIISDPTSFFGTGDDESYLRGLSKLRGLADAAFLAEVTSRTSGGNVYRAPDARPVEAGSN